MNCAYINGKILWCTVNRASDRELFWYVLDRKSCWSYSSCQLDKEISFRALERPTVTRLD